MTEPGVGHNSIDNGHLKSFIERVERMEEEKKAVADDIKDIYAEARGSGFDVKIMRKLVALRKIEKAKRDEEAEILDRYMVSLGMV